MAVNVDIESLFDEILLEIFSYLNVKDLVISVQRVCCRWKEISSSSKLWKTLAYRPECDADEEDIINVLKGAPKLKSIHCDLVVVGPKMIRTLANNCGNIQKLELGEFKAFSHDLLRELRRKCPHLEHLTVQETIFHDIKMGEIIGEFPNLKSLIILQDPYASGSLIKIKPLAEGCPKLEHLDVKCKIARTDELEYLLVKKRDKLRYLGLVCWTEDGYCTLPLIPICTQLNTLNISYACHSHIVEGLRFSEHLSFLTSFSWTQLGTTNLNQILEIFCSKSLCQLNELNITRYTNYEDILLNTIVRYCPMLKKIHLSECWNLTDESLKDLHVLKHLQSVDFCASKVSDFGARYLVRCEQLRYIDLSCCCRITGKVLLPMTRLRQLKVLILDGCNIRRIPIEIIPSHFVALNKLSLCCCFGIRKADVDRLRNIVPLCYRLICSHKNENRGI